MDERLFFGEVDRRSRAYAVWTQESLNRVANAGLTADGDLGPLSIAAIKRFQAGRGLTPDGTFGARTEAALIAAGASSPPGLMGVISTSPITTSPAPIATPSPTAQTSATGVTIPIPVPAPCVQVPILSGLDQGCSGVDSSGFARMAEVAAFAAQVADCYANRMAQRRQQERHATAQDAAGRQARSIHIPNESRTARARRIASARAAVQAEPVEAVLRDIRGKYLVFLTDEFRDTIIGANNRWGPRCRLNSVARQWMFGVREQLDFVTLGTDGRGLGVFAPPPRPVAGDQLVDILPPATTSGGARVQPIMNTFLRELRAREPGHNAYNYPGHGGSTFNGRGYSIDIEPRIPRDERGFYERLPTVEFILAVDAAARAAGVEWRGIYNDYAVAAAINRHLDRKRVIFVGQPRRGGQRIGLNWHGPLILHIHVDIRPRTS